MIPDKKLKLDLRESKFLLHLTTSLIQWCFCEHHVIWRWSCFIWCRCPDTFSSGSSSFRIQYQAYLVTFSGLLVLKMYWILKQVFSDQVSSLLEKFIAFGNFCSAHISCSDVKSHSSMGNGKSYHYPLHTSFQELATDFLSLPRSALIVMTMKAQNHTLEPDNLTLSALVFTKVSFCVENKIDHSPKLMKRAVAANHALGNISCQIANILSATCTKTSSTFRSEYNISDRRSSTHITGSLKLPTKILSALRYHKVILMNDE